MTLRPLLVIHGVGNRSEAEFIETTKFLREKLATSHRFIHVFWGDLGGSSSGLLDVLPSIYPPGTNYDSDSVRSGPELPIEEISEIISTRAFRKILDEEIVRSENSDLDESIKNAIEETVFIRTISEIDVLESIGDLISSALEDARSSGHNVRSHQMVRSASDLNGFIRGIIISADRMIGKFSGNLGGTFNNALRERMATPISLTFGDVVAYHQNREAIQNRIFEILNKEADGWGIPENPIDVMAHSLGGLAALEAALGVNGKILWINRLVTFGSQPAFFHAMTPRFGLAKYERGRPAKLPNSIKDWTNLWHRLDVLAFSTRPVFQLFDGRWPTEIDVTSRASEMAELKGWLHSIYWSSEELINAVKSG